MVAAIKLRDITAAPGTKAFGKAAVGEWPDGSPVSIPVVIVNGRDPGPVVMVTAGVHGDEAVGTEAIRRIATDTLDPNTMRGTFIGLPAVNVPSFVLNARVNTLEDPFGWNDLAYLLPTAQKTGSLTERIACFVRDDVAPLCEYIIDLHSSAKGSTNYPRAIVAGDYVKLDAGLRRKIDRLAEACGYEYIFKPKASSWPGMYFAPFNLFEEKFGKAGIILETGHAPTIVGADILVRGMQNILVDLEVIKGKIERYGQTTFIDRLVAVRANRGGIWHPRFELPYRAKEGEVLGNVTDLGFTVLEEVRAPLAGVAIKVATSGAVATGTRLYVLGIPY